MLVKAAFLIAAFVSADGDKGTTSKVINGLSCDSPQVVQQMEYADSFLQQFVDKGELLGFTNRCMNISIEVEGGDSV